MHLSDIVQMYNSFLIINFTNFVVHSWYTLWAVTRCGRLLHTYPVKWLSETRWRWGAPPQTSHCLSIRSDLVVLVPPQFYFSVVSQIYSRNSDGEPFGWWHAMIRMIIGQVILSLMQTKKYIFHCTRQYLKQNKTNKNQQTTKTWIAKFAINFRKEP